MENSNRSYSKLNDTKMAIMGTTAFMFYALAFLVFLFVRLGEMVNDQWNFIREGGHGLYESIYFSNVAWIYALAILGAAFVAFKNIRKTEDVSFFALGIICNVAIVCLLVQSNYGYEISSLEEGIVHYSISVFLILGSLLFVCKCLRQLRSLMERIEFGHDCEAADKTDPECIKSL